MQRNEIELAFQYSSKLVETSNASYIQAATSDNTRAAYQSDIQHFLKSGGRLPASVENLVRYLNDSPPQYNARTIVRRMTALRQWHKLQGEQDPTQDPRVTKTLRGISRLHGQPKQQAAALSSDWPVVLESFNSSVSD